jgi:hypothetical protein
MHRDPLGKTMSTRTLIVVLFAATQVCGCFNRYALTLPGAGEVQSTVEPGDDVSVLTQDGRERKLQVTAVDERGLEGTTVDGTSERIDNAQIARLDKRELDTGRTAGAIGATAVLLYALSLIALVYAFSHLDDAFGGRDDGSGKGSDDMPTAEPPPPSCPLGIAC